ncbi:hypothetical protein DFR46_2890 [Parasphingopyxis lamellibrachiae]|uniref:Uncharacterized protein n=2 Tax=Parasphingopyxis lamellibrachiae TaxID=680125 RepID=A0A3D9F952_9SPHN|nr:hypothetical protein DFR46_2890 [Parasphingopyxis lamellibrachiae]
MEDRKHIHDFVHRLWQSPELRARFEADAGAVLAEQGFAEAECALLLDGEFPALGELGMHPLAQMVYSLARNPQIADQISFGDYLEDLE